MHENRLLSPVHCAVNDDVAGSQCHQDRVARVPCRGGGGDRTRSVYRHVYYPVVPGIPPVPMHAFTSAVGTQGIVQVSK